MVVLFVGGIPDFFDDFLVPIRYNPVYFVGKNGPLCLKSKIINSGLIVIESVPGRERRCFFLTCMASKRLTTLVPDPSGMTMKKNDQRKMSGTTGI